MKIYTEKDRSDDARASDNGEDHLNWRYQNKEYNEKFKNWRSKKRNSVGFYYAENPNQLTYQDGVGFINDYPETRESRAFGKALTALGIILIYRVIFDVFSMFFLPLIFEKAGLDIHYSFFSRLRTGDITVMTLTDVISQILGRIIPTAILVRHLEMPVSVMLPTKVTNKPMFRFSVPAMLLTAGVCSVMSFFYEQILTILHIDTSHANIIPSEASSLLYIIPVQIFIVPIISELCTHGVILQFVRQFGDGAALVFTSFVIALATYDITQFPFALVCAVVTGYFTIRTGSVLTGILMRVVLRIYVFGFGFLERFADPYCRNTLLMLCLFLSLAAGLVSAVSFFRNHSDSFAMTIKFGNLSFGKKILTLATNIPIIIWFTASVTVTILNIRFMP